MNDSTNNIFLSDGQNAATSGKLNHGSLFSGIGGFDLAAEWMGWENVFHCEWNEFGQRVLNHYWPKSITYEDITNVDFRCHRGSIDILTGGFPCQPYSSAGKRKGKEDERHLWPEMLRAIREIQPRWVVGENVLGLTNWNGGLVFEEVQADLESEGYEVQPFILPAASVNAPHRRDRVWFIAHSPSIRGVQDNRERKSRLSNTKAKAQNAPHAGDGEYKNRLSSRTEQKNTSLRNLNKRNNGFISGGWENFPSQPPIRGGNDGLPTELDGITFSKWRNESIKAYGNAIVPQVVYQFFKAIEQYERDHQKTN